MYRVHEMLPCTRSVQYCMRCQAKCENPTRQSVQHDRVYETERVTLSSTEQSPHMAIAGWHPRYVYCYQLLTKMISCMREALTGSMATGTNTTISPPYFVGERGQVHFKVAVIYTFVACIVVLVEIFL